MNKKVNIFISYSHIDNKGEDTHIDDFIKQFAPLRNNGKISIWHDRKVLPGEEFLEIINGKLEDADIIVLFLSANYLDSPACLAEKSKSIQLNKNKCVEVVSVILSECGWPDDPDLSLKLALPMDGDPISNFQTKHKAWDNVYQGFKPLIHRCSQIKTASITEQFAQFIQNTELLSNAHPHKNEVRLDDIFIYPQLNQYDDLREFEKLESSEVLLDHFCEYSKVLIAGENQSGKTTLCKKIYVKLKEENFIPVYISDKDNQYRGKISNMIADAFSNQYEGARIEEINEMRIVPILDDFHFSKNKENQIQDLSPYQHQVVIVDDVFGLNFKNENLIRSFTHFKIKEMSPSYRNELIVKWLSLTDKTSLPTESKNYLYEHLDQTTELVNSSLGKIIGNGIMPAYPFFILTIVSTFDAFTKPLDQEITSQGYCYQALIYIYLKKQEVKNDEVEIYINFLTEFAIFFYRTKKNECSKSEYITFMEEYLDRFILPIKQEILLEKLQKTQIISIDSLNNYSFHYEYLYYFFVAKYFAEHIEKSKTDIALIAANLHKEQNAYISIFIAHHTKHPFVLDEIVQNAMELFHEYEPTTLCEEELHFFDQQVENIVKEVLPSGQTSPEMERNKRLSKKDIEESERKAEEKSGINSQDTENNLATELRRSIKTVEVMGRILKNRAGSLEKPRLEFIFEEGMKVHLRILTSFFEVIRDDTDQKEIVELISMRIAEFIKENDRRREKGKQKPRPPSQEKLEKLSKSIFWNINFAVLYHFIEKIIQSLGTHKLSSLMANICDTEGTPASFLIKHGIFMHYDKNLQTDNIVDKLEEDAFSTITRKLMNFLIVNHCSTHDIGFKDRQKIEYKLKIPTQNLLPYKKEKEEKEKHK